MSKNRIVAAIEIGSSKVATLVSKIDEDPVSLESVVNIVGASSTPSKGIKKGQIVDIEEAVEATVTSVESAERMAGYNLDSAYVAIGGGQIHSQNSHGVVAISDPNGEINQSDVDRAIEAASAVTLPASREVIHVLPREYIVDGESGVRDPIGMSGVRLEVDTHIISASSATIKNIRKAVAEVGIQIESLVFTGLASAEAVVSPTEKELGCVLIDIGGGTTSIVAYVDGSISYSGVIPIGANHVTNDLAIGLRCDLGDADKIKLALSAKRKKAAGTTGLEEDELDLATLGVTEIRKISRKTLLEGIIRPRLNEIFTMVKIELEKQSLATRIPAGAIITGGGAETAGVIDSAKRMLGLQVRVGIPSGVTGLIDEIITPAYSTSIGLLHFGSKQAPSHNLTSFRKKIKLPQASGFFGKIVDSVRDLLP